MEKTYEMLVDNELVDGVYAISLVDSPAIETDFVLLSKNKINIELTLDKLVDKKRKVVCGAALVPDLIIPRKDYNIVFSKETIRKISENFLINNYKDNVTLQHRININGVYLVESWIIDDPEKDKSATLGYNLPVGTWMVSFKITDENLWNEYINSGILKGFSIEGNFTQQEVKLEKINEEEELEIALMKLYLAVTYTPADLDKWYVWKLGEKEDKKHCPICIQNNNKVKKLRDWLKYGIPAVANNTVIAGLKTDYKTNPYATYCEKDCNCSLVRVNAPEIKRNIIKPF